MHKAYLASWLCLVLCLTACDAQPARVPTIQVTLFTSPAPTAQPTKETTWLTLSPSIALLRTLGYTVLEASHPQRALQLAATHTPDLLITDVVLPDRKSVV